MLKIFGVDKKFIKAVFDYKELRVETLLETGLKNLSFQVPLTPENIALYNEEMYVKTADYEYIIKEINKEDNGFYSVYCIANIEDIKGKAIPNYDAHLMTVSQMMSKALDGTGWTAVVDNSVSTKEHSYSIAYTSSLEVLNTIKEDFLLEFIYNTKEKKIYVSTHIGENRGVFFTNQLNLQMLKSQAQSYDYATRLIPIGKNGLTISAINGEKNYIENFQYTDKIITKYWIQEQYEVADLLKRDAILYLEDISAPKRAYKVDLASFGSEVGIGDTITLVDNIKKVKEKQRVVKILEYPLTPEKNKIELSNLTINFADSVRRQNAIIDRRFKSVNKDLEKLWDKIGK